MRLTNFVRELEKGSDGSIKVAANLLKTYESVFAAITAFNNNLPRNPSEVQYIDYTHLTNQLNQLMGRAELFLNDYEKELVAESIIKKQLEMDKKRNQAPQDTGTAPIKKKTRTRKKKSV